VTRRPDYSIVVPVYDEQDAFPAPFERLRRLPSASPDAPKWSSSNDGSRDDSHARS
jgi:hypothetical protein